MTKKLKTILSIAGSDPGGGAGIQADIRTANLIGFHALTAVTAVTVQNSKGLLELGVVSSKLLENQLNAILSDTLPDVIKIGMIGSEKNLLIIEKFLKKLPSSIPVVVDPVFFASSNQCKMMKQVSPGDWAELYTYNLFPLSDVVTPNLSELKILMGEQSLESFTYREVLEALKSKSIILTGCPQLNGNIADILVEKEKINIYVHPTIKTKNLHGTGCVYSTLFACYLYLTSSVEEAFNITNSKMQDIVSRSIFYSLGNSEYGPLNINNYSL